MGNDEAREGTGLIGWCLRCPLSFLQGGKTCGSRVESIIPISACDLELGRRLRVSRSGYARNLAREEGEAGDVV